MIINILLGATEPPAGHVVAGARQLAFAGWLELFQILAEVARPSDGSAGGPGPGELAPGGEAELAEDVGDVRLHRAP